LLSLCSTLHFGRVRRWFLLSTLIALIASFSAVPVTRVQAETLLMLPTPSGEPWRIIQGYACGTHNSWDRYSLDLAQVDGPTYGAPIRAALEGTVWSWTPGSGTLILRHSDTFFTMYTHLQSAVSTARGRVFRAGEVLGYAGDRGSPGTPHLHFTAYTAAPNGMSSKQSIPLKFIDGYDLPEIGGCNQYGGRVLTALPVQPPQIAFDSPAQPGAWHNSDQRIEFTISGGGGGLSQDWGAEPNDEAPMFPGAYDGYAQLADAEEGWHTLYVRAWGLDGQQTVAAYGPIGYDNTAPLPPTVIGSINLLPETAAELRWPAAIDNLSGVAGYRIYLGSDPHGRSDWFVDTPTTRLPGLSAGNYYLRVQTIDLAGNTSAWVTIAELNVE
jgi:murein DD-endopeptidase MepM/ murein hydrolase activator NlpD